jgi:hypothetical protein
MKIKKLTLFMVKTATDFIVIIFLLLNKIIKGDDQTRNKVLQRLV